MKKFKLGFTLSEVLITLAIIGVVATVSLPALMTNTNEQQASTQYRKIIKTLSELGAANAAIAGTDYSSIQNPEGLNTILRRVTDTSKTFQIGNLTRCIAFIDNTAVCLGSFYGGEGFATVIVDVNGRKGPNALAQCEHNDCQSRGNRRINDQYYVTLVGSNALPGKWSAMNTPDGNFAANNAAANYAAGTRH